MIYALDSNVISEILRKNADVITWFKQKTVQGYNFIIPPIVYYEIDRGLLAENLLVMRRAFIHFSENINVGEFNLNVWKKAAQIYAALRKQGKLIGEKYDGDYFIAAYCIINGFTLITSNKDHFERIDGLCFENWRK